MHKQDCIFCQIALGKAPSHTIWEDDAHIAFLSIFPNTEGFTIIATKQHYGSYAFEQDIDVLCNLTVATKKVATVLDKYYQDVSRCGMIFEGFGVDHLHSKLFPMHGTGQLTDWEMIESKEDMSFYETYPGYISSNSSHRADDTHLAQLAKHIRESASK